MKYVALLASLSALSLIACAPADLEEKLDENPPAGPEKLHPSTEGEDPLGVDLEAVGLSAGDRPCGDDTHVASVVDQDGRYLAFCTSASGYSSVLQVTPGSVAPIGSPSSCALDTYLAATPADAPVPRALLDSCERSLEVGRRVSDDPVVVGEPKASLVITGQNSCSSTTVFEVTYCAAIDDYATDPAIMDAVSWCGLGPYSGNLQRTASVQGLPGAYEGRMTVAACGTASTNLKGSVKKSLSGTWTVVSGANVNIYPGYVATRDIHIWDVSESDGWSTYYGADLRFNVTPSTGAWYRYSGAYIEYSPVP